MLQFPGQKRALCSAANESMPLCDANIGFSGWIMQTSAYLNAFLSTEQTVAMPEAMRRDGCARRLFFQCIDPLALSLRIICIVITRDVDFVRQRHFSAIVLVFVFF